MKRIVLTGAALAALLTGGISSAALAATPHAKATKTKTRTTVSTHAKCTLDLITVAPAGSTAVLAGSTSGMNYGAARCPAPLRGGVARQSFSESPSGALTGKIQQWFGTGSVYGTFDLKQTVNSGPPTVTSFSSARFYGTVTITGGSGVDHGATGTGTMSCHTTDSVHYTCIERVHLISSVTVAKS